MLTLHADAESREQDRKDRLAFAWHVAALGRVNRLPRLADLLEPRGGLGKAQTELEMRAAFAGWRADAAAIDGR